MVVELQAEPDLYLAVVLDEISRRHQSGDLENITTLTRAYLRRLPPGLSYRPEEMAAQILSLCGWIAERPQPVAVRVLNPTEASHGYRSPGTVVEVNVADSPFLIDSLTAEIEAHGLDVLYVLHPVVGTERDMSGHLQAIRHARHSIDRESVQHYELSRRLFDADLPALERSLGEIIADVRRAVADFAPLLGRVDRMAEYVRMGSAAYSREEVEEAIAFLHWLREDNYVFLGYREYRIDETSEGRALRLVPGSGLGLLHDDSRSHLCQPRLLSELSPAVAARYEKGDLLVISKTNRVSTVHRRAKMDYVGVRLVSPTGVTIGEARMQGLFTSKAYMERAARIPILRRKLSDILIAEDLIEGSHDAKAATQFFEGFSKDDLFASPTEELRRTINGLITLRERQQVRIFVRRDLLGRSVSVLVAMPRDRFNPPLRKRLQELLRTTYGGSSVDYHLTLGETDFAQVHFTVWIERGEVPEVDLAALEEKVVALTRSWRDRVKDALESRSGPAEAERLASAWGDRFPDYYMAGSELGLAAGDIAELDRLAARETQFAVGIQNETSADGLTRIALYRKDGKRPLAELVPALGNLGLQVVEEVATRLSGPGSYFIHDFGVLDATGHRLDLAGTRDRVVACLEAVWDGRTESDLLHRLVIAAGLTHQQVAVLRAYRTYWRRLNTAFTVAYIDDTLVAHPEIAAQLARLFELRFDPHAPSDQHETCRNGLTRAIGEVPSLDHDRILSAFLRMIEATLRTNVYRSDAHTIAFKLRSDQVPDMPRPYPFAEIFVFGPGVEGVHLRGGPVARGGIRWSDRREDYRTEVLGLMKAQMVKNAVIVPTGAKGGFVLRRPPENPAELSAEVRRQYELFIESLLQLTDNLVDGGVVNPPGVRVFDGPDPYLVVAADRGTATFSDLANDIARRYGFWLDDAFASGGSAGYDHKALGITARGAWRSAERHFLELELDPYRDAFTVVGIGDMSGDVFGNGMLGSDRLLLVAAFDHRHIFVDPHPDPAASYAERRRLFELARSSWADYRSELISPGGGVWPRSAKRIELSPEARTALGIERGSLTPAELIRAILQAPVDLLWNGGIGTYVKASTESDQEVGDRSNDAVRVNATQLRCRIVVEGGNLGFTQRGRIEYAAAGGKINTDFIDNSGGVDCSDREVNLKILLGLAEARGELERTARDDLVARSAGDVVERILYDNFQQSQMLSQEEEYCRKRMEAYEELIASLVEEGLIDRQLDALPSTEEMLERSRNGVGLTRPELAVVLSNSKRSLYDTLIESDLLDSEYLLSDLRKYFPGEVVSQFAHLLGAHPLRRELVANIIANDVVNAEGSTFVHRLSSQTGAKPAEVVRAFRIARDVADAIHWWEAVEALAGKIDLGLWNRLMEHADRLVVRLTRWYLSNPSRADIGTVVTEQGGLVRRVIEVLDKAGPEEWREQREERAAVLVAAGVPQELANRHVFLPVLVHAPAMARVADGYGVAPIEVANAFLKMGSALGLDRLEAHARSAEGTTPWQRWASRTLEDELFSLRERLVSAALASGADVDAETAIDQFLADHVRELEQIERLRKRFDAAPSDDLSPLVVTVGQLRALSR
jgi:glutamate dehydrogenase